MVQAELDGRGGAGAEGEAAPQQSPGGGHHRQGARQRGEEAVGDAFQLAAQYIALSQALQPGKDIYCKSLQVPPPAPSSTPFYPHPGLPDFQLQTQQCPQR